MVSDDLWHTHQLSGAAHFLSYPRSSGLGVRVGRMGVGADETGSLQSATIVPFHTFITICPLVHVVSDIVEVCAGRSAGRGAGGRGLTV